MSSAQPGVSSRLVASAVLDAVLHRGQSLKAALAAALPALDDPRDRALVEAIVFAALRQRARYDAALKAWLRQPLARRDAPLRALLLAGFAQLDALGLPAHAAVDASVETARALGRAHQAGLVNALLRRAQREGLPPGDVAAGWPDWLLGQIQSDWPERAQAIFEASAQAAPLWLRVNQRMTSREDYRLRLHARGIAAASHPDLADALRLQAAMPVAELPGFSAGMVSVQDGSAQQVADALAPTVGARVLDACAAPGGKTAHLLERDPSLRLTALDIDPRGSRQMQCSLQRTLQPSADPIAAGVRVLVGDATTPEDWWDGIPFDRILIDAPCSATGIVRRQPDILLHRRASDIQTLRATQAQLLDTLWPLLAPAGALVYATCSILRDENERQIDAFLARTHDAQTEPLDHCFGLASGPGRQRLPGDAGMDGFFYARLVKIAA